jgi:DNA-directed RNA polymerase subunit RPC12/RpoP
LSKHDHIPTKAEDAYQSDKCWKCGGELVETHLGIDTKLDIRYTSKVCRECGYDFYQEDGLYSD